ncbi:hypothetical protein Dvul_0248 [Nitratidesulfovibrio vulgaris DP4]|uniref:Uncharacterized protein n=1 Tax=Nitratidesulfovibrio vulgaris (strain DP4) TaxID=391774 RepID=A0A0H3A750_NITV4|nr:hypothetical protein Dvul_0248 [Nitratidesulfovibrio vulgaris DP4]
MYVSTSTSSWQGQRGVTLPVRTLSGVLRWCFFRWPVMRGHDLRERLGFKRWFHLAVLVGGQVLTCSNEDLNTTDARGESLAVVWWSRQGAFGHPTHLASSGRTWVLRAHSGRLPPDMPRRVHASADWRGMEYGAVL